MHRFYVLVFNFYTDTHVEVYMYVSIYVFVYIYIYIIFICVPPKITLPVTNYMSPILEYSAPQG